MSALAFRDGAFRDGKPRVFRGLKPCLPTLGLRAVVARMVLRSRVEREDWRERNPAREAARPSGGAR